jgi:hypothetical protein
MIMDEFKVHCMSSCLNALQYTWNEVDLLLADTPAVSRSWTKE